MKIQCPTCSRVYEWEIDVFPVKVKCEECGAKSLIDEDGEVRLLEPGMRPLKLAEDLPPPPARPVQVPRKIVVSQARRSGPSASNIASVLLIAAGLLVAVVPQWRKMVLDALGGPQAAPVVEEKAPDVTPVLPPEPEKEVADVVIPDVAPPPPPPVAPEPEVPKAPTAPQIAEKVTVESLAPDVFRVFQTTLEKIATSPDKKQEAALGFLQGMFTRSTEGATRAVPLAAHPDLLLDLLANLWGRIEESSASGLAGSTTIVIRQAAGGREFDLTETYVKALTPDVVGKSPEEEKLATIARSEDFTRLIRHFNEAADQKTPANALVLGRMVYDFRKGRVPLSEVPSNLETLTPDSLPDVRSSVDLADYKNVRDLVKWAHGLNPSGKETVEISPSEASLILDRAKAYLALPPNVLIPHPGSAELPGRVAAKAPRVEKQITVNLNRPRWQATGLYAPPGEVITVIVPAKLRKAGAKLRIGADTDTVLKTGGEESGKLSRFPIISREIALDDNRITTGSPFGGALYIDVAYGENGGDFTVPCHGWTIRAFDKLPSPDPVELTIAGAVEMPWWRPGMSSSDWREELKKPAPRAEMDFGKLAACVPTEAAKKASDPAKLTEYWTGVMDAQWKFGGYPGTRLIPMRVSFDRQISAGFMHSGYPIMAHLPEASGFLNMDVLRSDGDWGLFHEIGHNHQPICITPEGFGEATVNLYSLATLAAMIPKKDPFIGHPALADLPALVKARKSGKDDAFTNLAVFIPLIKEFGIESLEATLRTYWDDSRRTGHAPGFPAEQREDEWARRFGEVVKRDVSDYFESMRFHVSASTRKKLEKFKSWQP